MDDNYGNKSSGEIEDFPLQLVQVMHRKTDERWIERAELVTDDLNVMFWEKFISKNDKVVGTGNISCEWTEHVYQRHNIINDRKGGGIYLYKRYYKVSEPISFKSSVGNYTDEIKRYEHFREPLKFDENNGLKILLIGELAYNPERIVAFEERGHKLYGLWMNNPLNFNTIGPLPFGNVEDIPFDNWQQRVKAIKPDIIYALLNYQAINIAHHVLMNNPGIPFVWHFKEGPFYCRKFGIWDKLIDLYSKSNGCIYNNTVIKEWFEQILPHNDIPNFILDGDLPSKQWFTDDRSSLLSRHDGEIHTLIAGRPYGMSPHLIKAMADQNIHLHIYGDIFHTQSREMIDEAVRLAPDHLHLHSNCPQNDWVKEFSKYDIGWLHNYKSDNNGDLLKASWNDLNSPARMSTYAMAGVPMLVYDNSGHRVASQEYLEQNDMVIKFTDISKLCELVGDSENLNRIRENVWRNRKLFTFDTYTDDLLLFFRDLIKRNGTLTD